MQLKRLRETQDGLIWPQDSVELPVISWQSCKATQSYTLVFSLISIL